MLTPEEQLTKLKTDNTALRRKIAKMEAALEASRAPVLSWFTAGAAHNRNVPLPNGKSLRASYSCLNTRSGATGRWHWNAFGTDQTSPSMDWLLLCGEKDDSHPDQYKDDSEYVYFLMSAAIAPQFATVAGTRITLDTDFRNVRANRGLLQ